jgi:hypothetical protein
MRYGFLNYEGRRVAVERRQAERFPITVPVELPVGTGVTQNISSSGVFFETDQVLSTGALIHFIVVLEPVLGIPTHLHCQGEIVRVERLDGKLGVAVSFTSYCFEPPGG